MNCSETAEALVAPYPADVTREQTAFFGSLATNEKQRAAIEKIVRLALPPPDLSVTLDVAKILVDADLLDEESFADISSISVRVETILKRKTSQKTYPLSYAIKRLHTKGNGLDVSCLDSIRLLVSLAGKSPDRTDFKGNMFYKHVIAYRDVCELYRTSGDIVFDDPYGDDRDFANQLLNFIDSCKGSPTISETLYSKLCWTNALLDGSLRLGYGKPRDKVDGRQQYGIGKQVFPSEDLLSALDLKTNIQSAVVDEPWVDEDGVSVSIDYPTNATAKDRHSITRHVISGFARTNVVTEADMSSCSKVTYSDYLIHAEEFLNDSEFALTWLAAFAALDVHRPMKLKRRSKHVPQNDEIFLDKAGLRLEYNILRRRDRPDPNQYETCGLMRLPIAQEIVDGIDRMVANNSQNDAASYANKAAKKFSRVNPGLTPTLNRLRASGRVHFAPLGITELEFAAISGRISPRHLAISHYYRHSAAEIGRKFAETYAAACEKLELRQLSEYDLTAPLILKRDVLFCSPSADLKTVKALFASIATAYTNSLEKCQGHWHMVSLDSFVEAVNLHELSMYICQELALGLRPTGKIARLAAVGPDLGCMTADKASRLFAERSFSVLSNLHWKLLSTSQSNRAELERQLRHSGQPIVYDRELSDLACRCDPISNKPGFFMGRLTGQLFRNHVLQLPGIYEIDRASNWIRHVATEYIGSAVPRWQADEHFGHRQIGREPLGKWSTAGSSHFGPVRKRVAELLADLLPSELLTPIGITGPT